MILLILLCLLSFSLGIIVTYVIMKLVERKRIIVEFVPNKAGAEMAKVGQCYDKTA